MKDRILSMYHQATPEQVEHGLSWYADAHAWAESKARQYGLDIRKVAGVTAALSPMQSWAGNKTNTDKVLHAWYNGLGKPSAGLPANVSKAWAIVRDIAPPLDILSGEKVRAFYLNILGRYDMVTVDRWAWRAARKDKWTPSGLTLNQYRALQQAYVDAADELDLQPAILQAIVWLVVRE